MVSGRQRAQCRFSLQMNPTIRNRLQIFERLREKMPVSRFRTGVHAWRDSMLAKPAPALVVATGRALARDDATLVAAGVSFYALLSLFPLVLGLLSLLSFVLSSDAAQEQLLSFFLTYLPGAEPLLTDIAGTHVMVHGSTGLLSVLGCFSGQPAPCSEVLTGLSAGLGKSGPIGITCWRNSTISPWR